MVIGLSLTLNAFSLLSASTTVSGRVGTQLATGNFVAGSGASVTDTAGVIRVTKTGESNTFARLDLPALEGETINITFFVEAETQATGKPAYAVGANLVVATPVDQGDNIDVDVTLPADNTFLQISLGGAAAIGEYIEVSGVSAVVTATP